MWFFFLENIVAIIRRSNVIEDDDEDNKCLKLDLSNNNTHILNNLAKVVTLDVCEKQKESLFENKQFYNFVADSNISSSLNESKVRRTSTRRRFPNVFNDISSSNDRERPVKPRRECLQEFLLPQTKDQPTFFDISSGNKSSIEPPPPPQKPSSSSSSSITECSPIFAKPFVPGRIETARISSVSDLRRCTLITPSSAFEEPANRFKQQWEVSNKSFFRLGREKRSQSLHISSALNKGNRDDGVNDLTELLKSLEKEKSLNELGGGRRKGDRRLKDNNNFSVASDGEDKFMENNKKLRNGSTISLKNSSTSVEDISKTIDNDNSLVIKNRTDSKDFTKNFESSKFSSTKDQISDKLALDIVDSLQMDITQSAVLEKDIDQPTCSNRLTQSMVSQSKLKLLQLSQYALQTGVSATV